MQSRAVAAVVALLAWAAPSNSVLLSETAAREWLHDHPVPQGDDLAELKTANPEAYAIVKALLTKRSLGLLDPKHPTASFVPAKSAQEVPSGPEVFQALASPSTPKSSIAYPDVPAAPVHHDWMTWKPKESAADDESMVKSVLGAVAELKSGKSLRGSDGEATKGDASDSLEWSSNAPSSIVSMAPTTPPAKPASPRVEQLPSSFKDNSYLKSADLVARPTQRANDDSTDYLASFSWDDAKDAKDAKAMQAKHDTPKAAGQPAQHSDALLSWLGGSAGAGVVQKAAVTPAPVHEPENPYLSALN